MADDVLGTYRSIEGLEHYSLNNDYFGVRYNSKLDGIGSIYWLYCRESFQSYFRKPRKNKPFQLLYCSTEGSKKIMHLIRDVEEILALPQRSAFGPTQSPFVIWIDISPWWFQGFVKGFIKNAGSAMRKSFFTMMLRAGKWYDCSGSRESVERAFGATIYGQYTQHAIRRFLDGYTHYKGSVKGWRSQFARGDIDLQKLLVKNE